MSKSTRKKKEELVSERHPLTLEELLRVTGGVNLPHHHE